MTAPASHPQPTAHLLPSPTAEAAAHGQRVRQYLSAQIQAAPSRSISFADFMRAALYAPGLGYYAAGATKLGQAGDFVTAPEMSSFFGATLADAFAPLAPRSVLELGAGSGALAADFLSACSATDTALAYSILELSGDLRQRQQRRLDKRGVVWRDALPPTIDGLVLANEVLDAVPCDVIRVNTGRYEAARVTVSTDGAFVWLWQPLSEGALLSAARARVPAIEGYTTEINLEAEALVATLSERLSDDGALCFIDYGFPRKGYYLPDRHTGTLACHYQHRVHFDPLSLVGLQDITAHVDFTAMAEAAVAAGANVICYATQAQFLLASGLLTRLQQQPFANETARIQAVGAVQKLLSPSEMGELFKVLIVGKGAACERLAQMASIDQSFRL